MVAMHSHIASAHRTRLTDEAVKKRWFTEGSVDQRFFCEMSGRFGLGRLVHTELGAVYDSLLGSQVLAHGGDPRVQQGVAQEGEDEQTGCTDKPFSRQA
jgi:hypothetical protein